MPVLTVAICTYNNDQLLRRTLTALEEQHAPATMEWGVLVVDNNCTDGTPQVVAEFVSRGRIPGLRRVVEREQGTGHARRRAVLESHSELLAYLDDDCRPAIDWVQQAVKFFEQHPRAGAVGSRVHLDWEQPPTDEALRHEAGYAKQDYGDAPLRLPMTGHAHLVGTGLVLRRQALLESGWPNEPILPGRMRRDELAAGEDTEMILRIRRCGYELWYEPALQLQHMIPAQRMTVEYLRRLYRGFAETDAILCALARNRPATLWWRIGLVLSRLGYLARRAAAYFVHDCVLRRPVGAFRRIQIDEAIGQLHGAWRLLWNLLKV